MLMLKRFLICFNFHFSSSEITDDLQFSINENTLRNRNDGKFIY